MKKENIKRYTSEEIDEMIARGEDQTDWERLRSMTDDEIDTSDIPPIPDSFWENAKLAIPEPKKPVSLRVDPDILGWFKAQGKGYQTRINAVLRSYVKAQQEKAK